MSMSRARARRYALKRVPTIGDAAEDEWLGAEAHVRQQDRPFEWSRLYRSSGVGFNALALGLVFFGGLLLGSTLASLLVRGARD